MKTRISFLLALLLVIACSKDFTESPAVGALSDDALKNETGVNLMLTGAYSALNAIRNGGYGNGWGRAADDWVADVLSDDAHKGSTDDDQGDLKEIELYNWDPGNGYWAARWGVLFAGANRANAVIALINTIEGGDFSAQLAEARFLRGHFNFQLQRMWGNVPYISEENYALTEFNQPNSGPIWDKIEADFTYAKENLPASQAEAGRPTKWTATAYLGKSLIYQSKYAAALTEFEAVINSGAYALLPNYVDNFKAKGENGTESVFAIQFTTDSGLSFNANQTGALNFPNPGPFGSCCGFYQPTQDLANAFQVDANGLPLLDTYNDQDIANDYGVTSDVAFTPHAGALDPRIDFTVGRRGIDYNGYGVHIGKDWIRANFSDISGPYLPKKNMYYKDEASITQATGGWGEQLSGLNYHIIRYADVILMAAEAAVETGQLDKALDYVNQIRLRAKNSEVVLDADGNPAANYTIEPYTSFATADYARKAVRFERRLELGMEGQRLFDLRRWGTQVATMNEYFDNEARTITNIAEKKNTVQDKHTLLPIPIQAIDLSGGALTQNPGY
jgi:hypothetical protein